MMEQQGAEIEGEKGDVSPPPPVGVNNKNKNTTHVEEDIRKPAVEKNDLERDDDEGVVVVESPPPPSLIIKSNNKKSVRWSQDLVTTTTTTDDSSAPTATSSNPSNVYFSYSLTFQDSVSVIKDVLARWGNKVGEATRKAEDLSKNTWQHLNTAPSFADAALGRIAQGTKVLAEGGYEKIFRQTFEPISEEQLQNSFACYLSTSAGPVMGVMYLSTAKLAFCSDNPISYKSGDKTEWSYYKVVIPLRQLKAVNPSTSRAKSAEKFIQVISLDNHEFWYMGFLNYENAVHCMQEALQLRDSSA